MRCPVCGNKTHGRLRENTILINILLTVRLFLIYLY
ncbi:MAG: cysteine-rich KTR domain-containing protein [Ruminiclostridium sp.]|nr:cysteine-rich KTR domain-containing protein [Ruminiclostridium sp.]